MNTHPVGDPYTPPPSGSIAATPKESASATRVMRVTIWIFWVLLILSYPLDWFVAVFQPRKEAGEPDPTLSSILGVAALILVSLAVLFRWLVFQYLIHPKRLRPDSWKAALAGVGGALLVYALIKSVEIFGFILWLQAPSWPHYLAFAVPGCLLSFLTIPPWLMRRKGVGPP